MIDLHSHILPGVDDGSDSLEQSLAMARVAVADGIHTMVATPHLTVPEAPAILTARDRALTELCIALVKEEIPLHLLPGVECRIHPDLVSLACDTPGIFLGDSRTLLAELHPSQPLAIVGNLLFRASCADVTVVLAHPERHPEIIGQPDRLAPFVEQGLVLQVTAGALSLSAGWRVWRTARKLVGRRLAGILASDAHDAIHFPPRLSTAVARAGRLLRQDAQGLVCDTPARLLGLVAGVSGTSPGASQALP